MKPGFQTLAANQYEVIVSDDGQDYPAEAFCSEHYPWVRYIRGPRRGPAANRNCGARIASGDWLVFTDDDCLPDAGWLQGYADAIHQYPECKAFEGAILPDDWDLLKKDMAECPVNMEGGCFWSANIMVNKILFWKICGFDEQLKIAAHEDQDLYLRLVKQGETTFINNASICHPVRRVNLRKKISHLPVAYSNWKYYFEKYNPNPGWQKLLQSFVYYQKISFLELMHGRWQKSIFLQISGFYSFYKGILGFWGSKK